MTHYKAVVFDRDGTLNKTAQTPGGYVLTCDQLELLPSAADVVALARAKGIVPYVFTQQSCIGKGLLTEQALGLIHQRLQELLGPQARIEKFYYCPHVEADGCNCRKPKPGMLLALMMETGLKPHEVLVVGDSARDQAAASAAGMDYISCASGWPENFLK